MYVAEVVNQMDTWRASNPSRPFQFKPPGGPSSTRGRGNGGRGRGSRRGNSTQTVITTGAKSYAIIAGDSETTLQMIVQTHDGKTSRDN